MKILKGVIFIAITAALWWGSGLVKSMRLNQLVASGKIPYGPIPDMTRDYYSYDGMNSAFDAGLELRRSDEFSKNEFESLILKSMAPVARENFEKFLPSTLSFSEEYQIDPFWIISVMMVESGFNLKALSNKNARGLMQIRPDTAGHLYLLMRKKVSENQMNLNLHRPNENIEMGVFYLKKLLQNFRLNYHFATIAYNVGPNKLRGLISKHKIDTVNFAYLIKVKESYKLLTKAFSSELKKRARPFESTYVVKGQGRSLEEKLLKLYVSAQPGFVGDFLLSSENLDQYPLHTLAF
jgi:hypothetical protein